MQWSWPDGRPLLLQDLITVKIFDVIKNEAVIQISKKISKK